MHSKKLTVITYYHLNEKLLYRCYKGLQQQSFQDFEWLLLTHRPVTEDIPVPYTEIRLPDNIVNKPEAYNYVLPTIHSPFIAFNDGDDTSLPLRFEKQLAYFDQHPNTGVCSSSCIINDDQPGWPVYGSHTDIASFMLLNNPVVNPASMIRNAPGLFGQKIVYHSAYNRAEDYDFWFQCLCHGLLFHNIQEPLISYYVYPAKPENDPQENAAIDIRKKIWAHAGLQVGATFFDDFNDFCLMRKVPEESLLKLMLHLKKKYYRAPYQHGPQIIANYLDTYLTNYELRHHQKLMRMVQILRKGYLTRQMMLN